MYGKRPLSAYMYTCFSFENKYLIMTQIRSVENLYLFSVKLSEVKIQSGEAALIACMVTKFICIAKVTKY